MSGSFKNTLLAAVNITSPILTGLLPTGMAYGLLCASMGINPFHVILSSLVVFAGSVQFISIELIREQMSLFHFGIIVFLVHSRHMFYGISIFDKVAKTGKAKPFVIFALTDEAYAVYTGTKLPKAVNEGQYYFLVAFLCYVSWNIGTAAGVFAAHYVKFDIRGLEYALGAMFLVIMLEQIKAFKSKLPFIIGAITAAASLIVLGPSGMLLGCAAGSVVLLLAARKVIEGENL